MATHGRETPEPPYAHANRGYWTDGEESQRAPSERTLSEYTVSITQRNSFFILLFVLICFANFTHKHLFCLCNLDCKRTNVAAECTI